MNNGTTKNTKRNSANRLQRCHASKSSTVVRVYGMGADCCIPRDE